MGRNEQFFNVCYVIMLRKLFSENLEISLDMLSRPTVACYQVDNN